MLPSTQNPFKKPFNKGFFNENQTLWYNINRDIIKNKIINN